MSKLAIFYTKSIYCGWSAAEGIVETAQRMGHEVFNCGIDPQAKQLSKSGYPRHEELDSCDVVLVSGPEHLQKHIHALYPGWKQIKAKKIGWMQETVEREDYGKLPIDSIKAMYDVMYTPAAQDEKFGLVWLPFGVDRVMFNPYHDQDNMPSVWVDLDEEIAKPRDIDVAFIGLMYGPRQKFLEELKPHLDDIKLTIGNCYVQDLNGVNIRKSTELYASELRRTKVLLNMPSLSRLAVNKLVEAAACGCLVVTESLALETDARNELLKNALYYTQRSAAECANYLYDAIHCGGYADVARMGCEEVHKNHSLEKRLEVILS